MGADEGDFFLGAFVQDEQDPADAAAKEERAKRKEAGEWKLERILAKDNDKQLEIRQKYWESLGELANPSRTKDFNRKATKSPMRHLRTGIGGPELYTSLNVLAIRLLNSSVQYPIDVYGQVLIRDDIDAKRVFLFRRSRDYCQKINSAEAGLLSLIGPSRGILLHSDLLIEINLKIKTLSSASDIGIANCRLKNKVPANTSKVIRNRFVGELCSVDVTYAPVCQAVEATFKFTLRKIMRTREKPNGSVTREWQPFNRNIEEHREFLGKITVSITGIPEDVVLYDSSTDGSTTVGEGGNINLPRRVVAAPLGSRLSIKTVSLDGQNVTSVFPTTCGSDSFLVSAGSFALGGSVVWSTLYSSKDDDIYKDIQAMKQARQPAPRNDE